LAYWSDLARMLVEYPLTGVGLGVDTANQVALVHEINPDPERIFYAHNTFVQAYLEQGALGFVGELLLPLLSLAAVFLARRTGVPTGRRGLLMAGLGIVGGLEAHGLTDQVVTTTVGTALALVGLAMVLVALPSTAHAQLSHWLTRGGLMALAVVVICAVALAVLPPGRALVLLDLGGLQVNRATLSLAPQTPDRATALAEAEGTLSQALQSAPGQ